MSTTLYPISNKEEVSEIDYSDKNWGILKTYLDTWDIDASELEEIEVGDEISPFTCRLIATQIPKHKAEIVNDGNDWLLEHVDVWTAYGNADGCERA